MIIFDHSRQEDRTTGVVITANCHFGPSKGQLISKSLFGVFTFFQKNERKQVEK